VELSVMFFGAGASAASDQYDDVLAITRVADELGFHAVWTPERHFQPFGRIFPAPAVLGAALAMTTERIEIRAGSAVLPLHHPVRVYEEWAVLDHLSKGRAGFSVASGWHSTDFVLAPHRFAERREIALEDMALVRRLWAGEEAEFPDGVGEMVRVRPHPAPFRQYLPLWLTSSGSPRTWEAAGAYRTGVLAALPGHARDDLVALVESYRKAYAAAPPQPGAGPTGTVTLMMHAFVGDDAAGVRRRVREPLKEYFKAYARQTWSAKTAAGTTEAEELTDAQQDVMAEFAIERYLAWGSLVGTPDRCRAMLADLSELGCDEAACLVDFGLGRDDVIASLYRLWQVYEEFRQDGSDR
jgi:natural product biosynthesis luciferase-like monooxygenase protein